MYIQFYEYLFNWRFVWLFFFYFKIRMSGRFSFYDLYDKNKILKSNPHITYFDDYSLPIHLVCAYRISVKSYILLTLHTIIFL